MIEQTASEDSQENEREPDVDWVVEMRLHRRGGGWSESGVECGCMNGVPSASPAIYRGGA